MSHHCATDGDSGLFSPSTRPVQPFSVPIEPCEGVQNLVSCEQQNFDGIGSKMASEPWLGPCQSVERNYNAIDRRAAYDLQYCQATDNHLIAYTAPVPPENAAGAYQTSGYRSVDWTEGYQHVAAGHSADGEDAKERVSGSGKQLVDSCKSADDWMSGVTAKKIKQVRPMHGRRMTQVASRRASTGSLLCTAVSCSMSFQ